VTQRNKFNGEPARLLTLLRHRMVVVHDSTCWFVIDIEVTGSILVFTGNFNCITILAENSSVKAYGEVASSN
jgi:hypothetical protein